MLIMGIFLPRVYYVWQWLESIGLSRWVEAKNQRAVEDQERKAKKAVKERE